MPRGNSTQKRYSEDFKRDAVNLVVSEGYSRSAAANSVGVAYTTFVKWYDKYAPQPEPTGPNATTEQLQEEVKRLRKQLREAEIERDILKKATAYFAKESQ
jgi:transposase